MAFKSRISTGRRANEQAEIARLKAQVAEIDKAETAKFVRGSLGSKNLATVKQYPVVIGRPVNPSVVLLAFNKHIAGELQARLSNPGNRLAGTDEQEAIWREIKDGDRHVMVNAVAGSGKTTVLIQACMRGSTNVQAMTYHSLGMKAVGRAFGKLRVDQYKVWGVLDEMKLPVAEHQEKMFKARVNKVVSLAKQYGKVDRQTLEWIVDHHDVELNGMEEMVLDIVPGVLKKCAAMTSVIDFDDMIWLPEVLGLDVPRFDLVMSDEAQDLNVIQQHLALKAGDRHVVVGDRNQCHPPGTLIRMAGGDLKPIESIQDGDRVVNYLAKDSRFYGTGSSDAQGYGRKVEAVRSFPFDGHLVQLFAGGHIVNVTPNHKVLIRVPESNWYCVYLMVKGKHARIGMCRLSYFHGCGPTMRARQERAEKTWVLDTFSTEAQARVMELVIAAKFGLPDLIFHNSGQSSPTQETIDSIYSQIPTNLKRAQACLKEYGREWEYPLWTNKIRDRKFGRYSCVLEACNVLSGAMEMRTYDPSEPALGGSWNEVGTRRVRYKGLVYGIQVQEWKEDHRRTYVAGDLVVHNSIYAFRGADSRSMDSMRETLQKTNREVVELPLTLTRRCPSSHVAMAQKIVAGIRAFPDAPVGKVSVIAKEGADKVMRPGDMVLCRVNAELLMVAYRLLKRGVKAVVRGKDIGLGIIKLIEKAEKESGDGSMNVPDLMQYAGRITDQECSKFLAIPHGRGEMRASAARDKMDCLISISEGARNSREVKDRITDLFADFDSDGAPRGAVILSSVHRGKGLEAGRVFILRPDLMPHPMARQAHELEQEFNLLYVSITRARYDRQAQIFGSTVTVKQDGELVFVGGMPEMFAGLAGSQDGEL